MIIVTMDRTGRSSAPRHMWYLADAQLLIRELQEALYSMGFHVALGGGVLNHGYSDKDLDIYVLPLQSDVPMDSAQAVLRDIMLFVRPIQPGDTDVDYPPTAAMESSDVYSYGGKRVDVFVVKV